MCKGGRCWTAYTAKGAPPSRHTYLRLVLYEVLYIRLVHSGQKFQILSRNYDSFLYKIGEILSNVIIKAVQWFKSKNLIRKNLAFA